MTIRIRYGPVLLGLCIAAMFLVVACLGSDTGDDADLTRAEVEEIIQSAIAATSEAESGHSLDETGRVTQGDVVSIPSKSDPAEYTKHFVESAISLYRSEGLEATVAHYSSKESVDDRWYVFIVDEDGFIIAHPRLSRLGFDLNRWPGTDVYGHNMGPEMLSATEEGKWVPYLYQNPGGGIITPQGMFDVDFNNAWVMRHDGLLFGSIWHEDVFEMNKVAVTDVFIQFTLEGLQALTESLAGDPGSVLGDGVVSAMSYSASDTARGEWSIFIADEDGTVVLHSNSAKIGLQINDLLGMDASRINETGMQMTAQSTVRWVVRLDGRIFGAGWDDKPAPQVSDSDVGDDQRVLASAWIRVGDRGRKNDENQDRAWYAMDSADWHASGELLQGSLTWNDVTMNRVAYFPDTGILRFNHDTEGFDIADSFREGAVNWELRIWVQTESEKVSFLGRKQMQGYGPSWVNFEVPDGIKEVLDGIATGDEIAIAVSVPDDP